MLASRENGLTGLALANAGLDERIDAQGDKEETQQRGQCLVRHGGELEILEIRLEQRPQQRRQHLGR